VGSTIRVAVTEVNAAESSAPATSAQTAVVTATFGSTGIGGSSDAFSADRKRVNAYSVSAPVSVSKLTICLASTSTSGQADVKGLIYADSNGSPGALVATSNQLVFSSTQTKGWYDLPFSSPVGLPAGRYWIGVITGGTGGVAGFRYTSVSASRDYNVNSYSSGPTSTFGSFTTDSEQMSLYAAYVRS
jgi:hypothetical protein